MKKILSLISVLVLLSGCTGYRMTSNIPPASKSVEPYPVMVTSGDLPVPYDEIGPLQVVVRPASYFAATPTEHEARLGLMQKAREMGANAVIKVTYESRWDVISMGHIEAHGIAVKEK